MINRLIVDHMMPTMFCEHFNVDGFDDCHACDNCKLDFKSEPPVYYCAKGWSNGDEEYEPEPSMPWE